jgi:hypothetical protein
MNFKQLSINLTFLLISIKLFGQIDLLFKYDYSDDFKKAVYSEIKMQLPNSKIYKLYSDTLKSVMFSKANYFLNSGSYFLTVYFSDNNVVRNSVKYYFSLDGTETDVTIDISFHYNEKLYKVNEQWIKKEKIPKGYISITKYYQSPQSIKISLENLESNDYYKGPFFRLINNSRDTLYGEYLPGYFWGSLYISLNDSTWSRKKTGIIDTDFVDSPPLFPDSSKIATVGSFGVYNKLPKCFYKYELLFSKTGNFHGLSKYLDNSCMEWWTMTEEFYRLTYKFKID